MNYRNLRMQNGDYVTDNMGGLLRLSGTNALLQEVLFRLTARRGTFPFWEELGSQLWRLGSVPANSRQAAAKQYAAEALSDLSGISVTDAVLIPCGTGAELTVYLSYESGNLSVTLTLQ